MFSHDNDFGFDPGAPPIFHGGPSVTCVVPYYDTGPLSTFAVGVLLRALSGYRHRTGDSASCRVVVVDDASPQRAFVAPDEVSGVELEVVRLEQNAGRAAARNAGLARSIEGGATVFVDSDVVVGLDHISDIVDRMRPRPGAIVCGFFATVRSADPAVLSSALKTAPLACDWRIACVYQPSWVGCPADYRFVGTPYELVRQTRGWRDWRGMLGPWSLPNMVLGGCFAVPTDMALEAGGFDESFRDYGFTETTLVARLIARGCAVVPLLTQPALHVESQPAHLTQSQRNEGFRRAHADFYGSFLAGDP